uniref:Uncharacterized protein n=1 Tax=Anguilla anguilla TaxID=7936 RepID=A0A0E9VZA7_ANGAN
MAAQFLHRQTPEPPCISPICTEPLLTVLSTAHYRIATDTRPRRGTNFILF